MSMSDGSNELKKIMFQVGNKKFRFAINPENYVHKVPHRAVAIKTKSRVVVEDFQSDLATITIKGTTGYNPTGSKKDRGFNKIKELKKFLEEYSNIGGNGGSPSKDFYFHNFTNEESFVVHLSPEGFSFIQDVQSPLTFRYEINLVVLRKAGEPSEEDIIDPEIGNRFPSLPAPGAVPELGGPNVGDGDWSGDGSSGSVGGIGGSIGGGGSSGGSSGGSDDVYTDEDEDYNPSVNYDPINPQAPSSMSYEQGTTGLGYSIGYYGRGR